MGLRILENDERETGVGPSQDWVNWEYWGRQGEEEQGWRAVWGVRGRWVRIGAPAAEAGLGILGRDWEREAEYPGRWDWGNWRITSGKLGARPEKDWGCLRGL